MIFVVVESYPEYRGALFRRNLRGCDPCPVLANGDNLCRLRGMGRPGVDQYVKNRPGMELSPEVQAFFDTREIREIT